MCPSVGQIGRVWVSWLGERDTDKSLLSCFWFKNAVGGRGEELEREPEGKEVADCRKNTCPGRGMRLKLQLQGARS